jgi:hypothetical protein
MTISKLIAFFFSLFMFYADEPAPAAPPVVPEKQEPAPAVPKPVEDVLDLTPKAPEPEPEEELPDTGDPALDLALQFYAKAGIKADDPALIKAQAGDFTLLEAKLSVMGDKAKGWERFLALGKNAYTAAKTQAETKAAAAKADIVKVVGGDEEWNKVREWATVNASPEEKQAATDALRSGGIVAKAMAKYLHQAYQASAGTVKTPANAVKEGASGKPTADAPLTAAMYAKEVQALSAKLNGRLDGNPAYKNLQARRLAARQAGY